MVWTPKALIMALDMGGSATKALLCDATGADLASAEGPPFNARSYGHDYFIRIVADLKDELTEKAGIRGDVPSVIALGAAGAGAEDDRNWIENALRDRWLGAHAYVHHDAFIAHYGAFAGAPGVVIISGTGSIAWGRNQENVEGRSGGWGWMIGDDGGGWWMGREAVRAMLAASEGGPFTVLTRMILDVFEFSDPKDLLGIIYRDKFDRTRITTLSPLVTEAAEQGDTVALDILFRAGKELGVNAIRVASQLAIPPHELEVALLGSVATKGGDELHRGIDAALGTFTDPQGVPKRVDPLNDPVHGAALWGLNNLLRRSFA